MIRRWQVDKKREGVASISIEVLHWEVLLFVVMHLVKCVRKGISNTVV